MTTIETRPATLPVPRSPGDGRAAVAPALRAAVATLPPSVARIAGYHFGWLDADGAPARADGGKSIRPAVVAASAVAVGGDPGAAVPAAVAVELVHNFSLLHDDVMDGDTTRRHRPTAWTVFGTAPAILVGDALLALATDVLAGGEHPASQHGTRLLAGAVQQLIDGQLADLDFEHRHDVDVAACLDMAGGKTAALLGCSAALGALFGGGRPEHVTLLERAGTELGLAFQFVDDLLGIWGDPRVTGKPVGNDLRTRKKSLPVVAALTGGSAAGAELAALYAADRELGDADVARAADLVEAAGARDWCADRIEQLLASALGRIRQLPGPSDDLVGLARLIACRDH